MKLIGSNIDLILIILGLIIIDLVIATKSIFLSGIFAGTELLIMGITIAVLSNLKRWKQKGGELIGVFQS